ncbi:hypothetical protein ABXS75_00570 [Roseburia hominis]
MNNLRDYFNGCISVENIENITRTYLKAALAAEKVVNDVYEKTGSGKPRFPIDIEMIAREHGFHVEREELNSTGEKRYSRMLGKIFTRGDRITITVDNSVSYKTQRYAIAHAIGRWIISSEYKIFESSYAIPLIPQGLEEVAADVVALFLLLPLEVFKEEFVRYLDSCRIYPLDVDEWLSDLSNKSQISLFNLSIGYQQLKQVLCWQRQQDFEKSGFNIDMLMDDPYGKIFA